VLSCGSFEPDSLDEYIKVIDDAVVEAVELRSPVVSDSGIGAEGANTTESFGRVNLPRLIAA